MNNKFSEIIKCCKQYLGSSMHRVKRDRGPSEAIQLNAKIKLRGDARDCISNFSVCHQ